MKITVKPQPLKEICGVSAVIEQGSIKQHPAHPVIRSKNKPPHSLHKNIRRARKNKKRNNFGLHASLWPIELSQINLVLFV